MEVLALLYTQTNIDVFMMDWEKTRGRLDRAPKETPALPVSVWRTMFVANEWNEIQVRAALSRRGSGCSSSRQTSRIIDLPLTLLFLLFILVGLRVDYTATSQPDISDLTAATRHPLLRFALSAFWLLLLAALQVGFLFCLGFFCSEG
jgi:meckelin